MSGVVIVALPSDDEEVWKLSSEKKPHLTLLYLGDVEIGNQENVIRFVEHAASVSLSAFGLSVDRRGELGADKADVLFFNSRHDSHNIKDLRQFRAHLLTNPDISKAYNAADQYPMWTPHLTMGYPEAPAKEPENKYDLQWINFDRIAVWTGDFDGPEFRLDDRDMEADIPGYWSEPDGVYLKHYGRKGMRWGVRRPTDSNGLVKGSVEAAAKAKGGPKAEDALAAVKAKKGSKDHKQVQKNLKKRVEDLSTAEIKEITARIEAVNKYKATTAAEKAKQKSGAAKIANWALSAVATGGKKATGKYIEDLSEGLVKDLISKTGLPKTDDIIKRQASKSKEKKPKQQDQTKPEEKSASSDSSKPKSDTNSPPSDSREAAVRDLADAIIGPDGSYNVSTMPPKGG